jgi:hypothetical protein
MKHSRRRLIPSVLALLTLVVASSACSGTESAPDAGMDSGTDAGPDAGSDAGPDAGTDAGTDSGVDSGVSEWRIFITNTVQNADLGGLDGADQLCASQAADAGLEGDFQAWLSTRSLSVSDRLMHADGPYVLVDGTLVANDWDDLLDGSIQAPINLDANGDLRGGDTWTGTLATGASYSSDDCAAFTSGSGGIALCGSSESTSSTWTENITPACSTGLRLYCIEQ